MRKYCQDDEAIDVLFSRLRDFTIRRQYSCTLYGAPIVVLPEVTGDTIHLQFKPWEKAVYKVVEARFAERVRTWQKDGQLKMKYWHIFELVLRLRQLCSHIFLIQPTVEALLEESDVAKIIEIIDAESQENSAERELFEKLRSFLRVKRAINQGSEGSHRVDIKAQDFHEDDDQDSEDDASICSACRSTPETPWIVDCGHIYCLRCFFLILEETRQVGKDEAPCRKCGNLFGRGGPYIVPTSDSTKRV